MLLTLMKLIALSITMVMVAPLIVATSSEFFTGFSLTAPIPDLYDSPNKLLSRKDMLRSLMTMRGGGSEAPYQKYSSYESAATGSGSGNFGDENPQSYANGFANYNPPTPSRYSDDREEIMLQESVQARHDNWKSVQMEKYANRTPEQEYNPRDDQGRMKLMSSVSKGSRAFIFFILMWRDIYLFEVTDQSIKGSLRKIITRGFLTTVFLGNLAGVVTSLTSQGHNAKNRLKAILNLDKVIETALLIWNLGRVTLLPSKYIPREIFVAGILHSCFFLIQCQAFTRVTWDERVAPVFQQKQQHKWQQQGVFQSSNGYQGAFDYSNNEPPRYSTLGNENASIKPFP